MINKITGCLMTRFISIQYIFINAVSFITRLTQDHMITLLHIYLNIFESAFCNDQAVTLSEYNHDKDKH